MPKLTKRLTALAVSRAKAPGMYPDGEGLYLQVTGQDSKSWIYRYSKNGRARWLGLGSARDGMLSLSDARAKRDQERARVLSGGDPVELKREASAARKIVTVKAINFRGAASQYIAAHRAGWRNVKHADQWEATLAAYAYPLLGDLQVSAIDVGLVLRVLEPIHHDSVDVSHGLALLFGISTKAVP